MERGPQAMGAPDVEVIITNDFDATVRKLLDSTTYSSDRGTGTVGPPPLPRPARRALVGDLVHERRLHPPAQVTGWESLEWVDKGKTRSSGGTRCTASGTASPTT